MLVSHPGVFSLPAREIAKSTDTTAKGFFVGHRGRGGGISNQCTVHQFCELTIIGVFVANMLLSPNPVSGGLQSNSAPPPKKRRVPSLEGWWWGGKEEGFGTWQHCTSKVSTNSTYPRKKWRWTLM